MFGCGRNWRAPGPTAHSPPDRQGRTRPPAAMVGCRPMASRLPNPRQPFAPVGALAGSPVRLLLTSATLLFVELLLIRWIPANVRYVGFFSNFLLMASFLGIGVGILLGRRFADIAWSPFPGLLFLVVGLILGAKLDAQLRATNEIFFGLSESHAADVNFVVLR